MLVVALAMGIVMDSVKLFFLFCPKHYSDVGTLFEYCNVPSLLTQKIFMGDRWADSSPGTITTSALDGSPLWTGRTEL